MARKLRDVPPEEPGMPINAWLAKYQVTRLDAAPEWALSRQEREAAGLAPSGSVSKKSTTPRGRLFDTSEPPKRRA